MEVTAGIFVKDDHMFPQQLLSINNVLWSNILWNKDKNTMVMNHQKLVEQLFLCT